MFSSLAACFRSSRQIELSQMQAQGAKRQGGQSAANQRDVQEVSAEKALIPNKEFGLVEPFDTVVVRDRIQPKP